MTEEGNVMTAASASPWPVSRSRSSSAGFTLIEMMIALAVAAIVTFMAMPSFRDYLARTVVRTQVSDLSGAIRLARSEAIKRGRTVILCHTADALAAQPQCTTGSDWSSGWVIRQGEQAIRVQPAYANSGGILASSGITTLQFLPTGSVVGVGGSFTFRPRLAEADAAYARLSRRICLNAQGVTRDC